MEVILRSWSVEVGSKREEEKKPIENVPLWATDAHFLGTSEELGRRHLRIVLNVSG